LWEAALGHPALASFLDQNWLEGLERSAASHFTAVFRRLQLLGVVDLDCGLLAAGGFQPSARKMR
jgi:hypothetical protein